MAKKIYAYIFQIVHFFVFKRVKLLLFNCKLNVVNYLSKFLSLSSILYHIIITLFLKHSNYW